MSETIELRAPGGTAEAYVATPSHGGPGQQPGAGPGVLLYLDIIGLRPQLEQMADRIASWGYVVLLPNALYRSGTVAELAPTEDLREPGARERFMAGGVMDRLAPLSPEHTAADAEVWLAALLERCDDGPIATVGFCMGARLAVRTAGQFPGTVAAVAGFHAGGLVTDAADSPHLAIAGSTASYVFGHADHDRSMPLDAVAALEAALTDADRPHLNEIYEGAPHGYSMADTSMYDERAAARMWAELEALLRRVL